MNNRSSGKRPMTEKLFLLKKKTVETGTFSLKNNQNREHKERRFC